MNRKQQISILNLATVVVLFAAPAVTYQSHLAKVYVRQNRRDLETESLLSQVVEKDDRPGWREWADLQLLKVHEKNAKDYEEVN